MDIPEFRRHVAASELLKIINHLMEAKHLMHKAIPRIKQFGRANEVTQAIEANIDAISAGIQETVTYAAHARDHYIKEMEEPDAQPLRNHGSLHVRMTPFQRQLMREGVEFPLTRLTEYDLSHNQKTNNRQKELIRIIPFQLSTKRPHTRRKGKNYIPL